MLVELLFLCLLTVVSNVFSKLVEESSTGALLSFPYVLDGALFNQTWEVEPAAFGFADYGGTLEAYLILPANESYHLECDDGEPALLNEYLHYTADRAAEGEDFEWILVIDRGDCYFATKVYNAQQLGASGVIVIDYKSEGFIVMWEPDDFEYDVVIPSVELKEPNGETLMEHLGVENWDPSNLADNAYPSVYNFTLVKAKLEWGLPHEDDRVEWEMWTSANDDRTIEFKKNFKSTALALDYANDTVFTPHYYILNGSHWGCDSGSSLRCGNQCSNSGRYCAVDPEYDLNHGIAGMDVIQENLRELCIWNFTTHGPLDDPVHNESIWWDYVNLWNENCFNNTNNENLFTADCSYQQMASIDFDGSLNLAKYVNGCIEVTGGYGYTDGENSLLDFEVTYREDLSVDALPTFRINEFMIWGEVDCAVLTEQGCSILDSICSGFINGTEPDICHATPAPTPLECDDEYKDCMGVCYGSYQIDRCGECEMPHTSSYDACVGCDNVTNSGFQYNDCNICANSKLANFSLYGTDCAGRCDDNTHRFDDCGICRSVYSSEWNGCIGCDGVPHSGKELNTCGYCILNTTENFETYGQDCDGECDGFKQTDQCGQCLLTSDSSWNACISTDTSETGDSSTLSTVIVIFVIIALIVFIIAGFVIYRLFKKQKETEKAFDNIKQTYQLMDEVPKVGNSAAAQRVPTHDIDEEEDEDANNNSSNNNTNTNTNDEA